MRILYKKRRISLLVTMLLIMLWSGAEAQIIWTAPAGTAWLNPANWAGGTVPGSGDVAQFGASPTSGTVGVGIHMDSAGGSIDAAALWVTAGRNVNLAIGNSSTVPGTINLGGGTVGAYTNAAMVCYSSNRAALIVQPTQGSGSSTMSVNINGAPKVLLTGAGTATLAGNTLDVRVPLTGNAPLTFLGGGDWDATTSAGNNGGILKLSVTNTSSAGLTAGNSDGTQSGIIELNSATAHSNYPGNNININPNSQLYLSAATGSTYSLNNVNIYLAGNGNGTTTTGKGALINLSGNNYTLDAPVVLTANTGITVAGSTTTALTISEPITGNGVLTKQGPGNLIISAASTWTGGTVINAGKITVNSGSSISGDGLLLAQNGSAAPNITFGSGDHEVSSLSSSFASTSGAFTQIVTLNSGSQLTVNQSANTTFGNGATATMRSYIEGAGRLAKSGTGTLTLNSSGHNIAGGLIINEGTLRFSVPAAASINMNSCTVALNGGTLSTVGTAANTTGAINFGTLTVAANSVIELDSANAHTLKFAASATVGWSAGVTLTIKNWRGLYNSTAGTRGRIFFGNTSTALNSSQVARIKFQDSLGNIYNAILLTGGELVAAIPQITTTAATYGPFCGNVDNSISVAFATTGTVSVTSKVQLSAANGIFSPDFSTSIIGTGTTSPITAVIPAGTATGTAYRVRVINNNVQQIYGTNNGSDITITNLPVVNNITGSGIVPRTATVQLSNTTPGGTWSSSNVAIATVTTSGLVTGVATGVATISYAVTNSCGLTNTATRTITVVPVPAITAVSPLSGRPGATVTITGTDFNATAAGNIVYFGNVRAAVTAATTTSLSVTVPLFAPYAFVSVTDTATAESATSADMFLPLYDTAGLMTDSINFKAPVYYNAGGSPIGLVSGDLDGDGKPEIVVVNSGPGNVMVYRNTTADSSIHGSSFAAPVVLTAGVGPHYVRLGDIDGDGRKEIVIANKSTSTNRMSVYKNNSVPGTLTFATRIDYGIGGTAPTDVAIADFDLDGKNDVAVVLQTSGRVAVLRNVGVKGTVTAGTLAAAVLYNTGSAPYKIAVADLDNDGRADMAVTNYSSNTISLFHNDATTGVIDASSFSAAVNIATSAGPTGIAIGDIDGDGRPDLVTTGSAAGMVSVLRNTNATAGVLSFAAQVAFASGAVAEDVALGDINADGKPDIVSGNYIAQTVSVFRNRATSGTINSASLAARVDIPLTGGPAGIDVADLDKDGKPDIAVAIGTDSAMAVIKNYPLPPIGITTGADSICVGSTTTLTNSVAGGYWHSSNTALATVTAAGVVTAIAPGTDTIYYYTVAQGDTNVAMFTMVTEVFRNVGPITGPGTLVCAGAVLALADSLPGGVWQSSNAAVATVNTTGFVHGVSPGLVTISYSFTNSCGTSRDTIDITVNPSTGYVIGEISGPTIVCAGAPVTYTDTSTGGVWSTADTAIATINATTGSLTGVSYGTAILTYGYYGSCGAYLDTQRIVVDTTLNADTLIGPAAVCQGATITLTNLAGTWGMWTASNGRATVIGGVVTGVTPGTDTITYVITNVCGSATASKAINIRALPEAGIITGPATMCAGTSITLTDTLAGGVWGRTNNKASVSATGVVTAGSAAGKDTILYMMTNGCGTDTARHVVTILTIPTGITITGASAVCVSSTVAFSGSVPGGTFTSLYGFTSVADSIITGLSVGIDTIRYTVTNMCGSGSAKKRLTVNPLAEVDSITGPSTVCTGDTIRLYNSKPGGVWGRTNTRANISATGLVTGVTVGVDTIKYTITNSCGTAVALKVITINKSPVAGTITSGTTLCAGATMVLRASAPGGVWTSTNDYSALVDSVLTGVGGGIDTIAYTVTNQCGAAVVKKNVTIIPRPVADSITGPVEMNVGDRIELNTTSTGGVWMSSNTNVIISADGFAGGLLPGKATILYVVKNSCGADTAYHVVTVLSGNEGSETDVQMYPNPNSGVFTVNVLSRENEDVALVISDATYRVAKLEKTTTNKKVELDLNLPSGVYYLSAVTKDGWYNLQFVIAR